MAQVPEATLPDPPAPGAEGLAEVDPLSPFAEAAGGRLPSAPPALAHTTAPAPVLPSPATEEAALVEAAPESAAERTGDVLDWLLGAAATLALLLAGVFVLLVVAVALARPLLGWQFVVVSGASMEPTIDRGAVVVIEDVAAKDLAAGDIIMFRDSLDPSRSITHRVVEVNDGGSSFTTRGDANSSDDTTPVAAGSVRGRYRFTVPFAGQAVRWLGSGQSWVVVAFTPALLLGAWELWAWLGRRRTRRAGPLAS